MTILFKCPYCDYEGSEAWNHLVNNHPDKRSEWDPNYRPPQPKDLVVGQVKSGELTLKMEPGVVIDLEDYKVKMHKITRRLEFDAGHRVYQHESKCNNLHGHRYVVEVECTGSLDELGRIVDFSVIKTKFGKWIDDKLDHGTILFKDDPLVQVWKSFETPVPHGVEGGVTPQKHYIMDKNPTAENLAELLYKQANDMLKEDGFTVTKITIWETPNCRAEYSEVVS